MVETTYTVEVKTGHKGTNADIEIFLIGTKGIWKDYQLMDNPGRDDLEPNQVDVFTFIDDNDIGIVTDIAIRPRGAGLYHDNWKMQYIKVKSDARDSRETTFKERKRIFNGAAEPVLLRAENFTNSNVAKQKTETVLKREYMIVENNFGGNAMKNRTVLDEIIEKENLRTMDENLTSIKQSYEVKRSASATVDLVKFDASITFAGEIATAFKKQVTTEIETQKKQVNSFSYEGKDNHCNFFIYKEFEVLAVGNFDNSFINASMLKQVVKKETIVEVKSFKAVDQSLPGTNETFAELWKKASNDPVPVSPKMADVV